MKRALKLIFIVLIVSCEKEDTIDKITPIPGWVVERLNEDYYIQIPEYFTDNGTGGSCFRKFSTSKDIFINQCNSRDYFVLECVGDSLSDPHPDKITGTPSWISSWFLTLNNKDYLFNEDSVITGILYSSDKRITEEGKLFKYGRYYKKIDAYFISMLRIHFNVEKVDTVEMIYNSIGKI